jgi:hypothetical protein
VLVASKTFLSKHMLNEDGEGRMEVLKGKKLCKMMDKFITLVASFKHWPRNRGYVSSIFAFKANSGYYFIQDHFLGQQTGEKMFLFKMPMHGDGNYCDLVKQMQPRGDLQTTWIMFDHVKRIEGWKTLAYHVYDSFYYKV